MVTLDMARKRQDAPSIRGYKQRGLRLKPTELAEFDADALPHGGPSKYLRYLWQRDRISRGLVDKNE